MQEKNYGTFAISRKLKNSWLHPLNENRKFTKYEAWIWMIEQARYFCSEPTLLNDKLIVIPRGYFSTTVDYLSLIFRWNERTTEKYLKSLEKTEQISRYKINPKMKRSYTLIKVNKYNYYQPDISEKCNSKYKTKCNLNCTLKYKLYKKDKKGNNYKNVDIYGSFKNIILSKEENEQIELFYGDKYNEALELLSNYIKAKGEKYESHFAVLSKYGWVYKKIMSEANNNQKEIEENGYCL